MYMRRSIGGRWVAATLAAALILTGLGENALAQRPTQAAPSKGAAAKPAVSGISSPTIGVLPDARAEQVTVADESFFSPKQMEQTWKRLMGNERWTALMGDAKARGFTRVKDATRMWGMSAQVAGPGGKATESVFCVWDFEKPGSKEPAAVIYASHGAQEYMACLILPPGAEDLEKAAEWYVDDNGQIQQAHSWKSCMKKKLKDCGGPCIGAMAPCLAVSVTGAGAFSPALYLSCLAIICGSCLFIVNLICAGG